MAPHILPQNPRNSSIPKPSLLTFLKLLENHNDNKPLIIQDLEKLVNPKVPQSLLFSHTSLLNKFPRGWGRLSVFFSGE
jgi:hypothetical protein